MDNLKKKARKFYLGFTGAPPDKTTEEGTGALTSQLEGLKLEESEDEIEQGDKIAHAQEGKSESSLANAVFDVRPTNPLDD